MPSLANFPIQNEQCSTNPRSGGSLCQDAMVVLHASRPQHALPFGPPADFTSGSTISHAKADHWHPACCRFGA